MSLIAPKSGSSNPPAPEGSHAARCVSMIDLGSHESTGQYGTKKQRKIRLSFELPEETAVFNEEKGPQPYMVHRDFTFSMHEKAALRLFLEGWRGVKFTDQEAVKFDVSKLLTVPAMLNIVHAESGGRVYANIASASRLPRKMECPPQVNKTVEFSLSTFDEDVYHSLPDWLQQKIAESDEYKAIKNGNAGYNAEGSPDNNNEDDIPF